MDKIEKYELMYSKFSWILILMACVSSSVVNVTIDSNKSYVYWTLLLAFFAFAAIANYLKIKFIRSDKFSNETLYLLSKAFEMVMVVFSIEFIGIGNWGYILPALSILVTSLRKGRRNGSILVLIAFATHILLLLIKHFIYPADENYLLNDFVFVLVLYYVGLQMFAILCGFIFKSGLESEDENKALLDQLEEKYEQLAVAQEEIKLHYDKLKDTNNKLEDTNRKLTGSIAEFYTLQQISQAIGSIFEIKELLKYVNDIILGVMGVNYSTIILYDEKRSKLKVHTTSIKNRDELITLSDNINCPRMMDSLYNGKQIIENIVDHDEYAFTQGREVNSLIIIPLSTKTRKFGLVLIEHKYYNAFDEENVRLLDIIGQQVGIAMENAELYQKMHELATTDSLTGVYNRLYFQERLQKEFADAKEEDYQLSLAIFDIDFFKRFNDTFGHLFGDKVLKHIADLVKKSMRNTDILARYGGEEFIILFPRTGLKEAFEKVETLRQKIAQSEIKDNLVTATVTVSFGVCSFPEAASTESELIRLADDALYEAKNMGRNCARTAKVFS